MALLVLTVLESRTIFWIFNCIYIFIGKDQINGGSVNRRIKTRGWNPRVHIYIYEIINDTTAVDQTKHAAQEMGTLTV